MSILILWYIIGVVSGLLGSIIHDKKITVNDVIMSFTVGGILGIITMIIMISVILGSHVGDIVIWRKK